jgi:endonuclease-3 related protein
MRLINSPSHVETPWPSDTTGRDPLLLEIYQRLYRAYGAQGWWPGDGAFDVVVGAILTQAAAWTNVERAIDGMKQAGCWSMRAIHEVPVEELASIIRSSGYFNAKARKLKAFAKHLDEGYAGDLSALLGQELGPLREELLSIHGIGPETADDILVYAAEKPSFIIDSYTRRIVQRVGLFSQNSKAGYRIYQEFFHKNLSRDVSLFNEYHALLDHHAKVTCAKVPLCSGCCLKDICATGISRIASH